MSDSTDLSAAAGKPKKPEGGTGSKDGDSRASTPSKEIGKDDKGTPTASGTTSTGSSRARAAKPGAVSTPLPADAVKDAVATKSTVDANKDDGQK